MQTKEKKGGRSKLSEDSPSVSITFKVPANVRFNLAQEACKNGLLTKKGRPKIQEQIRNIIEEYFNGR